MSFVHLQACSEFSLLRSACRITRGVAALTQATGDDQPAVAITDHGNMFGVLEFYMETASLNKDRKSKGLPPVKPILGCQIYVDWPSASIKDEKTYQRLTLLAENNEGYHHLLKIVSYCYEKEEHWADPPAIPLRFIREKAKGIIALAGEVNSRVGQDIIEGRDASALDYLNEVFEIFGRDHLFLTLQDHGLETERQVNRFLEAYSKEKGCALVAVNNVHYAKKEDYIAYKTLRCIGLKEKVLEYVDPFCPTDQYYFKTAAEMKALFPDHPEAIENTVKIAERCHVEIETGCDDKFWPKFRFPPEFASADDYLAHLCHEHISSRYSEITDVIRERLETELVCIRKMKVAGYLLIVWDFIRWARENGIPVGPGRGSAAGSMVTYIIGITDIDPLRFDLLFERFLNPERVSMPDIDTDFSDRDRSRVVRYVTEKYGADCVTQIVTYGTLAAKAVVKDVGRVLGISNSDTDQITKMFPKDLGATLEYVWTGRNKKGEPLQNYNPENLRKFIESRKIYQDMWDLAGRLEGSARQVGIHAAAVIIAPNPMSDLAPIFKTSKDEITAIMYDKHYAEEIGLLKMDFLGLRNLSIIQDTVEMAKKTRGIEIDIAHLNLEDPETFRLLSRGLTVGVFQFESPGMQKYLKELCPERIEDLIAMNALYRPGPMEQIPLFINRKQGKDKVDCYHEDLNEVLGETYGVIVYQEQVMRIAQILGGYTLGGADNIRRIMAKKKAADMEKLEPEFIGKCLERGYDKKMVETIWSVLLPFCGYAFNKSHAAAYAYVAYQTAYLKTHFGPEFMAASMSSEISNTENMVSLMQECKKMDIRVCAPDINRSQVLFSVEKGEILYGLAGIKSVGVLIVEDIVAERELHGAYKDLFDFCKRIFEYQASLNEKRPPLAKTALQKLVMAGALDSFPGNRPTLLASVDKALNVAARSRNEKDLGQVSLFDLGGTQDTVFEVAGSEELEEAPEWTYIECLNKERDVLGMCLSGHPLDEYRPELRGLTNCSLAESEIGNEALIGKNVTVGGVMTEVRAISGTTKREEPFTFGVGTLQDFQGEVSLFFKGDVWERERDHIGIDDCVLISGKVELNRRDQSLQINVEQILTFERARRKLVKFIHVEVLHSALSPERLQALKKQMQNFDAMEGENECFLVFHLESASGFEYTLRERRFPVSCAPDLIAWLQAEFGFLQVWVSKEPRG